MRNGVAVLEKAEFKVDFNTRMGIEHAFANLLREAVSRVTRSWIRDLGRLEGGLGNSPALAAELHRTAKIRADWFDAVVEPALRCFARVHAVLDQAEEAPHQGQGRLQVAHLIGRIEDIARAGDRLGPLLSELLNEAPERIANELIKSVGQEIAETGHCGHAVPPLADRTGKQHQSEDRGAQENQHDEQTEADRKRDSETS
jgi:hypothetical protein